MKKIIKLYRCWRYRRLYKELFMFYAKRSNYPWEAGEAAMEAFKWITFEDYKEVIG